LIELMFYGPLNTNWAFLETFFLDKETKAKRAKANNAETK